MKTALEQTKEAFEHWRKQHGRKRCLSKNLKLMALELLNEYSYVALGDELEVSSKTIRNWEKSLRPIKESDDATFVTLPLTREEHQPDQGRIRSSCGNLTLNLPHGLQLLLPSEPLEQTSQLIFALVKEFESCSI